MITNYKIKLIEGEKSLKQEIEIEGDNKEEIISEVQDIFTKIKPFCHRETLIKAGIIRQ
jgi:hypothetical protein